MIILKQVRLGASMSWALVALVLTIHSIGAAAEPFELQVYGDYKRMSETGDTGGKVRLASVAEKPNTYGVGALAGLRGEVLVWDGKVLVSPGHDKDGRVAPATSSDEATLLTMATVAEWTEVDIPSDLKQAEFQGFVLQEARRRGLVDSVPYPFLVKGAFPRVTWHVVTGTMPGHGGHGGAANAQSRNFEQKAAEGVIVGFYSGDRLEGVISHTGERFHVHFASTDLSVSGHVEDYEVGKGSKLLLPLR